MARGAMGRGYTDAVENLAEIAIRLIAAETDESTYNAIDAAEWTPVWLGVRRTFGAELGAAIIRDAYALARIRIESSRETVPCSPCKGTGGVVVMGGRSAICCVCGGRGKVIKGGFFDAANPWTVRGDRWADLDRADAAVERAVAVRS